MRGFFFSLAVGLLLVATISGAGEISHLYRNLQTGQQALTSASSGLAGGALERAANGELDLDRSCTELTVASTAFGEAAVGVQRLLPMLRMAEWLPDGAARTESNLALVVLANEVSAAGDTLCQGMQPLVRLVQGGGSGEQPLTDELLATLVTTRPSLETARVRLARAEIALDRVRVEEQEPRAREALTALAQRLPTLRNSVDALLLAPDLLGASGPRTYFLVAQNRDELRPTGGYIGTAGVVRIDSGRVVYQEFGTSVRFDLPPDLLVAPPAPLVKYLRSSYWHLRDANWWPDFPSSAEQIAQFYNLAQREPVDGVLAFDQRTLELLLEQIGPVEVPGYGETLTQANLQERLDLYVHNDPGRDDEWQRKEFVGAAAAAVLQRLSQASPGDLLRYTGALGQALAGKHLQMYLGAPLGAQLAAELNWDGHMYLGGGDYLYAVSANISPNKVDPYIEREATYRVNLTKSPPAATLTMNVRNTLDPSADKPWLTTRYRDYLRVYAPWESTLTSATGFVGKPETTVECGRTAFGGLVNVAPGEQVTVSLEYQLNPAVLAGGSYTLAVQKQPGMRAVPLAVEVVGYSGTATLNDTLTADRQLRLRGASLQQTELPPADAPRVACAAQKTEPRELAPPARIALPRLGRDAPVMNVQVRPTGEMEVPGDGDNVGWYEASARPGYAGNFVAAAHVDWGGRPGVFWGLHELQPGDRIVVTDTAGNQYTYAVEWNRPVLPESTPIYDLVGPSHDKLMTLITCTGNFNRVTRDYSHRQIVRARLVEG